MGVMVNNDCMTKEQKKKFKMQLLMIMPNHYGKSRTIGMGELYEEVFNEPFNNRINDTRRLRKLVTDLRREDGIPIISNQSRVGGGYYYASCTSELADFDEKLRRRALKILAMAARIRKVSLPEYIGQLRLDLELMEGGSLKAE
jgi:hypothetical protein